MVVNYEEQLQEQNSLFFNHMQFTLTLYTCRVLKEFTIWFILWDITKYRYIYYSNIKEIVNLRISKTLVAIFLKLDYAISKTIFNVIY